MSSNPATPNCPRYVDPARPQRGHRADRHHVVHREQAVQIGLAIQQLLGSGVSAVPSEVAGLHRHRLQPGLGQPGDESVPPVPCRRQRVRSTQYGELPPAQARQLPGQLGRTGTVVRLDRVRRHPGLTDQRQAGAGVRGTSRPRSPYAPGSRRRSGGCRSSPRPAPAAPATTTGKRSRARRRGTCWPSSPADCARRRHASRRSRSRRSTGPRCRGPGCRPRSSTTWPAPGPARSACSRARPRPPLTRSCSSGRGTRSPPLSTREAVATDTPARCATSSNVTGARRFTGLPFRALPLGGGGHPIGTQSHRLRCVAGKWLPISSEPGFEARSD